MINRVLIFMILFALISCKKDEIINPYDHPDLFPVVTEDSVYFNNPSSFSAISNDYGYEKSFSREFDSLSSINTCGSI